MRTLKSEQKFLSLEAIAEKLAPSLAEINAIEAFLCGPYVRATRNVDLREQDKLHILVVADVPGHSRQRVRAVRPLLRAALSDDDLFPIVHVTTPEITGRHNGSDGFASDFFETDWKKIYDAA